MSQAYEQSQKTTDELVARFGFEPGKMQWRWRAGDGQQPPLPGETKDWWLQCSAALLDALVTMGSVPAWDGDGLGCAAQIVEHFAKRAEAAEAGQKKALHAIDTLLREIGRTGPESKWAEALNLASGVLLEARRIGGQ
jgi:hypothetical protein